MAVTLAGNLLTFGQDGLHVTYGDVDVAGVIGILLDHPCDQLPLLAREGAEDTLVLSLLEELTNHLTGRGSRHPAEILGGVVVLFAQDHAGPVIFLRPIPAGRTRGSVFGRPPSGRGPDTGFRRYSGGALGAFCFGFALGFGRNALQVFHLINRADGRLADGILFRPLGIGRALGIGPVTGLTGCAGLRRHLVTRPDGEGARPVIQLHPGMGGRMRHFLICEEQSLAEGLIQCLSIDSLFCCQLTNLSQVQFHVKTSYEVIQTTKPGLQSLLLYRFMQTLHGRAPSGKPAGPARRRRRVLLALLSAMTMALLPACSASRVTITAQDPQGVTLSVCERTYRKATAGERRAQDHVVGIPTREAWEDAANDRLSVAVSCPVRFEESATYAALDFHRSSQAASREGGGGISPSDIGTTRSNGMGTAAQILRTDQAAAAALAEDRAGFAMTVLAARQKDPKHHLLALADAHRTASQTLAAHSAGERDPREGIYSVGELLAHPDKMDDPANGLSAPVSAVVEMNAARELLAAIRDFTSADGGRTGQDEEGRTRYTATDRQQALRELSELAATHIYAALELGYPASPEALFSKDTAAVSAR